MDAWNLDQAADLRITPQPTLPVGEAEQSQQERHGVSNEALKDTSGHSAQDLGTEPAELGSGRALREPDRQPTAGRGPTATNGPTLLQTLLSVEVPSTERHADGASAGTTQLPTETPDPPGHKVTEVIKANDAAARVEEGDATHRVVHEIAVRLNEVFGAEVPMFSEGIPSGVQVAAVPVSKNQKKKLEQAAANANKGKAPSKSTQLPEPMTEERFYREHRKKLNAPKLGPQATAMLRALRRIGRIYLIALRGASDNPLGKNVFSFLGTNYIVNKERYVRPYDGSFAKGRDESSGYVTVEGSVFKAFDYPANTLGLEDFRRIIQAVLEETTPPVSVLQMTVFIAAVAAEVERYGPQLATVMLALTGVTDEKTTAHKSIFVEGLTMTTGGTDPGTGSHVDTRLGFEDQPIESLTRATDVSAKREGALIVSAFSQPPLSLDVLSYIDAQLRSGTSREVMVDSLADRLVWLMNYRAATAPGAKSAVGLGKLVTKEMLERHFPSDNSFSVRSVKDDSIVLLAPEERERLAWDIERNKGEEGTWKDGKFRTMGAYLVVCKSSTKSSFDVGRAHFTVSTVGSSSAKLNHWEGQDWLEKPKQVKEADLEHEIANARNAFGSSSVPEVNEKDLDTRIQNVLTALDKLPEANQSKLGPAIHEILEGKAQKDPGARKRALTVLAQLEVMLRQNPSAKALQERLAEWLPSNEWNVMPAGWVRGQASGLGYNCLIDSLLQLTTNLDQQGRLNEAKLIRYRLVQEGLTGPTDYLYGSYHALRVLQLIGVDPENYEVRTEWSFGGERKLPEVEGLGNPTVLRLWNTGGHYEPITIPPGQGPGDRAAHQSDDLLLRPGKPLWMATLAAQLVPDGDIGKLDNSKLEALAKAEPSRPKPTKDEVKATKTAFASTAVPGWEVSEAWEEAETADKDATSTPEGEGTSASPEPDTVKGSASEPAYKRVVTLTKLKPADNEALPSSVQAEMQKLVKELNLAASWKSGEVVLRVVLGSGPIWQLSVVTNKWKKVRL